MSDSPDQRNSGYKTQYTSAATALGEALDVVSHEDPDKHMIGGSLPVATDEELQPIGTESGAGASPFPARADHVHPLQMAHSVAYLSTPVVIPNTGVRTYLNTLANSPTAGAENWIGGTPQTIDFARDGLYVLGIYAVAIPDTGVNLGPGYLKAGIQFTGGFSYTFTNTFIENGQYDFFYDVTHFHRESNGGSGVAELWFENNCPVNVRVISLQFVGALISAV